MFPADREFYPSAPDNQTVADLLRQARSLLRVSESPDLDVQLLLADALGCGRASLLARPERHVDISRSRQFLTALQRRQQGEPLAYILGCKSFWDFELRVDPRVLIPRPETELLVETALECLAGQEHEALQLADLGTGSGAIAIALARHSRAWQLTASDRSADSLALAEENARNLAPENIEFVQSSWLEAMSGRRFDLIVSNPPYIEEDDPHLLNDGLPFEPRDALVAQDRGLACLKAIIDQAGMHLGQGGWLLLEHGYNQGPAVEALLTRAGFSGIRCWQDLAGLDRVTSARYFTRD